jgi:hypothetical protein
MGILDGFLGQVFNSPYNLKSYSHASRLYLDDYYKHVPKTGFLYYVVFNINSLTKNELVNQFIAKNGKVIGMLVKTTELPKFKIQTETLNQYNRKTQVHSKIEYQPIALTFHDDHNNTSTALWEAYYRYYFADDKDNTYINKPLPPAKYGDVKYKSADLVQPGSAVSYGLNNGIKTYLPFFRSIEIYQLNRAQFTGFSLVNPIISDWAHDTMSQSENKLLENKMTINYETVQYSTGRVGTDNPSGFATIHYDKQPSPLSILGSGNNSLLGPGGIMSGINELLGGDTGNSTYAYPLGGSTDDPLGNKGSLNPFQLARGVANLAKNIKNVSKAGLKSEAYSIAGGVLGNLASGKGFSLGGTGVSAGLGAVVAGAAGGLGKVFSVGGNNSSINGIVAAGAGLSVGTNRLYNNVLPSGATTRSLRSNAAAGDVATAQQAVTAAQANIEKITSEQTRALAIQSQYESEIAAAEAVGNQDKIAEIMGKMENSGYTDPTALAGQLAQAQAAAVDAQNNLAVLEQFEANNLEQSRIETADPESFIPTAGEPDTEVEDILAQGNQDSNITQYVEAGDDTSEDTTDYS